MVMENAWRQERHFNTSVRLTNIWTRDFHFLHTVSKKPDTTQPFLAGFLADVAPVNPQCFGSFNGHF
jgi:hypothetical protein